MNFTAILKDGPIYNKWMKHNRHGGDIHGVSFDRIGRSHAAVFVAENINGKEVANLKDEPYVILQMTSFAPKAIVELPATNPTPPLFVIPANGHDHDVHVEPAKAVISSGDVDVEVVPEIKPIRHRRTKQEMGLAKVKVAKKVKKKPQARAVRQDDPIGNFLFPDFENKPIRRGRPRKVIDE